MNYEQQMSLQIIAFPFFPDLFHRGNPSVQPTGSWMWIPGLHPVFAADFRYSLWILVR